MAAAPAATVETTYVKGDRVIVLDSWGFCSPYFMEYELIGDGPDSQGRYLGVHVPGGGSNRLVWIGPPETDRVVVKALRPVDIVPRDQEAALIDAWNVARHPVTKQSSELLDEIGNFVKQRQDTQDTQDVLEVLEVLAAWKRTEAAVAAKKQDRWWWCRNTCCCLVAAAAVVGAFTTCAAAWTVFLQ
jgi:hypothetical protein